MANDTSHNQPSDRQKFNRILGLSSYAGALIMVGLIAMGVFDAVSTNGMAGLKKDLGTFGMAVVAAVTLWAIGYTTGRRKPPAAQS